MPGVASLHARQYYAHPQNLFWKILGTALGFDPAMPYEQRTAQLAAAHIAVWDVLQSCVREGSLDADIEADSIVPNDFTRFFARQPGITRICFNGATAETLFRRHVLPGLPSLQAELMRLPSTSPANAGMSRDEKLRIWAQAVASRNA
ncbi:MAG: DNA-deoxyinosine glycosylase [Rhodocyclaceae bacterium]